MNRITFDYSTKNIPTTSKKNYLKNLLNKTEIFIKNVRWRAFYFLNPKQNKNAKETYGFKSNRCPPIVKELEHFENKMMDLIQNIEFKDKTNDFQNKLKKDIKKATNTNDLIIKADKTNNYYQISPKEHEKLMNKNIQKTYKKATQQEESSINKEAKEIATQLELEDRIEVLAKRESFLTLKDHKPNFNNNPTCRLINPAKSEIGRVSKQILEKIVKKVAAENNLNLWRNTYQVLNWFNKIVNKDRATFICFDIVDFYPSITEKLLTDALNYAEKYHPITRLEREIILHSKKTLLFNNNSTWIKKQNNNSDTMFDVPMGSYDGAETCELVVCYILSQLKTELRNIDMGLYRDDGLAISYGRPQQIENTKKKICKIFEKNKLRITIEANKKDINFLDVNLNLNNGKHAPFIKPDNKPMYVHAKSNHPPSVLKSIPKGINKRLSEISSDEETFKKSTKIYQDALKESGHNFKLKYEPKKDSNENEGRKKNRTRKRHITWYNPPFDLTVATNIGRRFLNIVDESFKDNALSAIFNRNTLKLSFSCAANIKKQIDKHNKAKLNQTSTQEKKECNCRNKRTCPLEGKCRESGIIYKATITQNTNKIETYVGLTDTEFKLRYANHKQSFTKESLKNSTELSKHIWNLKSENTEYDIKWEIIGKAPAYSNKTKSCRLCNLEKYFIIYDKTNATLNQRSGLINSCRHFSKFLLGNHIT